MTIDLINRKEQKTTMTFNHREIDYIKKLLVKDRNNKEEEGVEIKEEIHELRNEIGLAVDILEDGNSVVWRGMNCYACRNDDERDIHLISEPIMPELDRYVYLWTDADLPTIARRHSQEDGIGIWYWQCKHGDEFYDLKAADDRIRAWQYIPELPGEQDEDEKE